MNETDTSGAGNPGSGFQDQAPAPASGARRIPIFVWVLIGVAVFIFLCIIPIVVLIAIPTLGSVKNHANESAAIHSLGAIQQAELMYSVTYPSRGYACSLRALGGDPSAGPSSADAAQLMPADLASGTKSGYIFHLNNCAKVSLHGSDRVTGYTVTAVPVTPGKTGHRGFCSDESGVIKYDPTGGANCIQPLELQ
jgi:type IV pilus assembly protein PilA